MIIDAILYNGERDIFDLRYNILKDYVDEFVVCEFDKTFSGKDKEAHPINLPKVSYHFFTQWEELEPDMPEAFQREYSQREMINNALTHLQDNHLVLMGDCDEIWNPAYIVSEIPAKLKMLGYTYWLNNRSYDDFPLGTVVCRYGDLKNASLNELRSNTPLTQEYNGWHFTNMGGVDRLKYKIESYGHQEFNNPEIKDALAGRIEQNQDYIGRTYKHQIDESEWPDYLKKNKEKYRQLCK